MRLIEKKKVAPKGKPQFNKKGNVRACGTPTHTVVKIEHAGVSVWRRVYMMHHSCLGMVSAVKIDGQLVRFQVPLL